MRAEKIAENVFQVGVNDWNLRDFHGYRTGRGSSYNAYLVRDRKNCLVDTVKAGFTAELLANVSRHLPPAEIDYLVSNHLEPDHAGALPELVRHCPRAKILGTRAWLAGAEKYFGSGLPFQPVGDGETVALGETTLRFIAAPMLHWPESMMTWLPERKILLSNDAFGQHYAAGFNFDDEAPPDILMDEAARYYANILMPLSPLVAKLLARVAETGLPAEMIAPSHGVIWRSEPGAILAAYRRWSAGETTDKTLVAYATMWGSTEILAREIARGAAETGTRTTVCPIGPFDRSEIAREALDAKTILLGSPVLNNLILPGAADVFHYLKGLKPPAEHWGVFGSYGWNNRVLPAFADELRAAGFSPVQPPFQVRFRPDAEESRAARAWGARAATGA